MDNNAEIKTEISTAEQTLEQAITGIEQVSIHLHYNNVYVVLKSVIHV